MLIGYYLKDGERYDVFTVPTTKKGRLWWAKKLEWVEFPKYVMIRNKYGWAYLIPSNTDGLVLIDGFKQIVDNYWRDKNDN